jgi:riboflavin synthase
VFTGLVEEKGRVEAVKRQGAEGAVLRIQAAKIMADLKVGDSVAINGICLTVTSLNEKGFAADVMPETWRKTGLSGLKNGEGVNLERAMPATGRFGGHIVTGHIDGVGRILQRFREGNAVVYKISAPAEVLRYTVAKGSIAVDGISLTVASLEAGAFSVSLIPHTAAETTLGDKGVGDLVNLEGDCIGKFVEKLLRERPEGKNLMDTLRENGF